MKLEKVLERYSYGGTIQSRNGVRYTFVYDKKNPVDPTKIWPLAPVGNIPKGAIVGVMTNGRPIFYVGGQHSHLWIRMQNDMCQKLGIVCYPHLEIVEDEE